MYTRLKGVMPLAKSRLFRVHTRARTWPKNSLPATGYLLYDLVKAAEQSR